MPEKPLGAPPAVLTLLGRQTLLAAEGACALAENAEHTLAELEDYMADGVLTMPECRHLRGHIALADRLAEDQCSILKWTHRSVVAVQKLVDGYRLRLQEQKRAAGKSGSAKQIATSL